MDGAFCHTDAELGIVIKLSINTVLQQYSATKSCTKNSFEQLSLKVKVPNMTMLGFHALVETSMVTFYIIFSSSSTYSI